MIALLRRAVDRMERPGRAVEGGDASGRASERVGEGASACVRSPRSSSSRRCGARDWPPPAISIDPQPTSRGQVEGGLERAGRRPNRCTGTGPSRRLRPPARADGVAGQARRSGFGRTASPTSVEQLVVRGDERAEGPDRRAGTRRTRRRQAVRLVGPHEVGQVATQLVDDRRRHGIVHPRPDLDVGGVEPLLPDRRQGDDDVAADELAPVVVVADRRAEQPGPEPALPEDAVGPLEHRDAGPGQGRRVDDDPVALDLDPQPVLDAGPS